MKEMKNNSIRNIVKFKKSAIALSLVVHYRITNYQTNQLPISTAATRDAKKCSRVNSK